MPPVHMCSLIKVSAVASSLVTMSIRDMLEALLTGEWDPKVLADLARGRMKAKHGALVEVLAGRFHDHHAELARMRSGPMPSPASMRSPASAFTAPRSSSPRSACLTGSGGYGRTG
jgi:hypothetical protein